MEETRPRWRDRCSQPLTANRYHLTEAGTAPRDVLVDFILGWRVAAPGGGWRDRCSQPLTANRKYLT